MSGTSGGAAPTYTIYTGGGGKLPNECNSVLMSAMRGETLTPNPNECNSTLMSETREINLTRRNRDPVQKSFRS